MGTLRPFAYVFWVVCRGMVSAGAVDTPWLAAAAARQVCESVAVKAPVHPFRFDVIPGVAVVAPEEDVISPVVFCVRFVKAIMMGPWLTLSSVFRVTRL